MRANTCMLTQKDKFSVCCSCHSSALPLSDLAVDRAARARGTETRLWALTILFEKSGSIEQRRQIIGEPEAIKESSAQVLSAFIFATGRKIIHSSITV